MKRYRRGKSGSIENKEVDAFLREIVKVCKDHGFSLSHEDTHGAFIVERYDEDNIQWLMDAMIGESVDTG
jgi:sugar phosphate isomerase/epimerase